MYFANRAKRKPVRILTGRKKQYQNQRKKRKQKLRTEHMFCSHSTASWGVSPFRLLLDIGYKKAEQNASRNI